MRVPVLVTLSGSSLSCDSILQWWGPLIRGQVFNRAVHLVRRARIAHIQNLPQENHGLKQQCRKKTGILDATFLEETLHMGEFGRKEMEEALEAISSVIHKAEKARVKFAEGTPQHTLQVNRIKALQVASALISKELAEGNVADSHTKEDLEKALAPIASLISKSEKAREKVPEGSWQHRMLTQNLKALHIALPLVKRALSEISVQNQ